MSSKEWKLAYGNVRRKKSITISLTILVFLVAFFLDICLSLRGIAGVVDEMHTRLNGADLRVLVQEDNGKSGTYLEAFQNVPGITAAECVDYLPFEQIAIFADTPHNMEQKEIVESCPQSDPNKYGICMPISMKSKGYKLGDTYYMTRIIAGDYTAACEITAFARYPSMFATDDRYALDVMRIDMSLADLQRLQKDFRAFCKEKELTRFSDINEQCYLLQLADDADELAVQKAFASITGKSIDPSQFRTYDGMREDTVFQLNLYAGILTVFSVMVLVVICFVILFRISNVLFSEIKTIGALGAMGFSSWEIRLSYALQYILYTLVGTVTGIGAAYLCTPILNKLILDIAYFSNTATLHLSADLLTLLIIFGIIMLVLLLATRKMKGYPPAIALSGGMQSHSFRKNHVPVETSKGGLISIFARKNFFQDKSPILLIFVSVVLLTFATSTIMHIQENLQRDSFWNYLMGMENPKANVMVREADCATVRAGIDALEGVDKTVLYANMMLSAEGLQEKIIFACVEDFSKMEYLSVIQGELPVRDKEIALADHLAERLSKQVGDTITLSYETTKDGTPVVVRQDCLITGIAANASDESLITIASSKYFYDNPSWQIYVYSESRSFAQLKADISALYGEIQVNNKVMIVDDMESMMNELMNSYQSSVQTITAIMCVVTLLVILFLLMVVIRSSIQSHNLDFGIQKALGVRTSEQMGSIVLTYFPAVGLGAFGGSLLSMLISRQVISLIFRVFLATRNVRIVLEPMVVLRFGIAISLFAFLMTVLFAQKIKRITPCALISE